MKYAIIVLASLLFTTPSRSQNRVNSSLPIIGATPLWSITQATGWMKNTEGQWIEGSNKIQLSQASLGHKELWEKGKFAMGHDNFDFMEIRNVVIDGKPFLLFIKKMLNSDFQYSITGTGEIRAMVKYMVLRKKWEGIEKQTGPEPFDKYLTSYFYSGELNYSPNYLNEIALGINTVKSDKINEDSETKSAKFTLLYRKLNDGKNCRFFIEQEGKSQQWNLAPVSQLDDLLVFGVEKLYYECPQERLDSLVKLIKP